MDFRNRHKWNKNSLISNSVYLKMYLDTLKRFFSVEERHIIYILSKYFTDGVEYARKSAFIANICFETGERMVADLSPRFPSLMFDFIDNIYFRSKSYFHYKSGNYSRAITLIQSAIESNARLIESDHFDILLFDSISHHHNHSGLLRKTGHNGEADNIDSMLISFLLTNKSNYIFNSEKFESIVKDVSFYPLKYSNIYSLLILSIMKDEKIVIEEPETRKPRAFPDELISDWISKMIVQTEDDQKLKRWLSIYLLIRSSKMSIDEYQKDDFESFLNNVPNKIIEIMESKDTMLRRSVLDVVSNNSR
jgi:hypothetical protein